MDDKTLIELQIKVAETEARSKTDRQWFLIVGALILSFLGFTNFVSMPGEAQQQVKKQMPEHAKMALDQWMATNEPKLTVGELNVRAARITDLERQAKAVLGELSNLRSGVANPWVEATLQNGWEPYGEPYAKASFQKDVLGYVHLRGVVKASPSTGRAVVLTLPEGYRPEVQQEMGVACEGQIPCEVVLEKDGKVWFETSNHQWVSLDGIEFRSVDVIKAGSGEG
ncbi:MAG: hypothetical protein ACT4P0_07150 [Panacagrimonas sp.]